MCLIKSKIAFVFGDFRKRVTVAQINGRLLSSLPNIIPCPVMSFTLSCNSTSNLVLDSSSSDAHTFYLGIINNAKFKKLESAQMKLVGVRCYLGTKAINIKIDTNRITIIIL